MSSDHAYKLLFSEPRTVEDLLRGFVKDARVEDLDFSTLERVNSAFPTDDLRARDSDMIWRLRFRDQTWLYVYLLLEFQSRPDPTMALRVMVYVGLLYQDLLRTGQAGPLGDGDPTHLLPPVLPIVLYNGERPWKAATDVGDLVVPVEGLESWRPSLRYLLLDETRLPVDALPSQRNLVAAVFELERSRSALDVVRVLGRLGDWLDEPDNAHLRRAMLAWMSVTMPRRMPGVEIPEINNFSEVRNMLAERLEAWVAEESSKAEVRGKAEGKAEERVSFVERLLTKRFGPLSDAVRARIPTVDSATVVERIFTAASAEEAIADPSEP